MSDISLIPEDNIRDGQCRLPRKVTRRSLGKGAHRVTRIQLYVCMLHGRSNSLQAIHLLSHDTHISGPQCRTRYVMRLNMDSRMNWRTCQVGIWLSYQRTSQANDPGQYNAQIYSTGFSMRSAVLRTISITASCHTKSRLRASFGHAPKTEPIIMKVSGVYKEGAPLKPHDASQKRRLQDWNA